MSTWKQGWYVVLGTVVTTSTMVWLGVPHAAAGATTMIVGLGFIRTPPRACRSARGAAFREVPQRLHLNGVQ